MRAALAVLFTGQERHVRCLDIPGGGICDGEAGAVPRLFAQPAEPGRLSVGPSPTPPSLDRRRGAILSSGTSEGRRAESNGLYLSPLSLWV